MRTGNCRAVKNLKRLEVFEHGTFLLIAELIGKIVSGVALAKSTCVKVAAADRDIGFGEWYFLDRLNPKSDPLVIDRLVDASPNRGSLLRVQYVPQRGHAAVMKIRRAGPHAIQRRCNVAVRIHDRLLVFSFTGMREPTVGVLLPACRGECLQPHRIRTNFIDRNAAIRITRVFAVGSVALGTMLVEDSPALLRQRCIDGTVVLGRRNDDR